MSTRSAIILKVKKEDVGKTIKFNAKKLPNKMAKWGIDTCMEKSKEVTLQPFIGIYCHFNGYIGGVGTSLKHVYNDYDSIINLLVGGDCSWIVDETTKRYAIRKGEKWDWIKPTQGETAEEVSNNIGHNGCVYLFDEECGWKFSENGNEFSDYNIEE